MNFQVSPLREEKVKAIVDDILDKIPDQFNMAEIMQKVEERTPYVIVALQVNKICLKRKYSVILYTFKRNVKE